MQLATMANPGGEFLFLLLVVWNDLSKISAYLESFRRLTLLAPVYVVLLDFCSPNLHNEGSNNMTHDHNMVRMVTIMRIWKIPESPFIYLPYFKNTFDCMMKKSFFKQGSQKYQKLQL